MLEEKFNAYCSSLENSFNVYDDLFDYLLSNYKFIFRFDLSSLLYNLNEEFIALMFSSVKSKSKLLKAKFISLRTTKAQALKSNVINRKTSKNDLPKLPFTLDDLKQLLGQERSELIHDRMINFSVASKSGFHAPYQNNPLFSYVSDIDQFIDNRYLIINHSDWEYLNDYYIFDIVNFFEVNKKDFYLEKIDLLESFIRRLMQIKEDINSNSFQIYKKVGDKFIFQGSRKLLIGYQDYNELTHNRFSHLDNYSYDSSRTDFANERGSASFINIFDASINSTFGSHKIEKLNSWELKFLVDYFKPLLPELEAALKSLNSDRENLITKLNELYDDMNKVNVPYKLLNKLSHG